MTSRDAVAFAGFSVLWKGALGRERVRLAGWVSGFAVMAWASGDATANLYPNIKSLITASNTVNSSGALVAIYGRVQAPDAIGSIAIMKLSGFGSVVVALVSAMLAVRHTRGFEQSAQGELLSALPVGRLAVLGSAAAMVATFSALLSVATTVAMVIAGMEVQGSVAFGLAWGSVALSSGGVGLFLAQLVPTARGANGLCAAFAMVAFLLRAIGDVSGPPWSWLRWLSPIGWAQQVRPFAGEQWWVLALGTALGLGCFAIAARWTTRRDFGAALWAISNGNDDVAARIGGPMELAWKLHRVALAAWVGGFAVMGVFAGALATSVEGFMGSDQARDYMQRMGGQGAMTDAYLAIVLSLGAVVSSAFAIAVVGRMHGEELQGQAELLLSTPLSRLRWAGSHSGVALGGLSVLVLTIGVSTGLSHAIVTRDWSQLTRITVSSAAQLPPAWAMACLAIAGFGLTRRFASMAWWIFAWVILLSELGPLWELPRWIVQLSPFAHAPRLPGPLPSMTATVVLSVVSLLLVVVGSLGFSNRDVGTG